MAIANASNANAVNGSQAVWGTIDAQRFDALVKSDANPSAASPHATANGSAAILRRTQGTWNTTAAQRYGTFQIA